MYISIKKKKKENAKHTHTPKQKKKEIQNQTEKGQRLANPRYKVRPCVKERKTRKKNRTYIVLELLAPSLSVSLCAQPLRSTVGLMSCPDSWKSIDSCPEVDVGMILSSFLAEGWMRCLYISKVYLVHNSLLFSPLMLSYLYL